MEDHDFQTCPRCGVEAHQTVYLPHVVVECGYYYDFDTNGEMICENCVHELALEVEGACERWDKKETDLIEVNVRNPHFEELDRYLWGQIQEEQDRYERAFGRAGADALTYLTGKILAYNRVAVWISERGV